MSAVRVSGVDREEVGLLHILGHVGPTDPGGRHPDDDLARAGLWFGSVLDSDISGAVIDDRFHVGRQTASAGARLLEGPGKCILDEWLGVAG
jgi:hypothetical protein